MSTPSAHSRRLSIDSSSRPSAKRHKTDSSTDSAIDTPSPPPEPDRDNSDVTSSLPPLPDNEDQSERPSKSGKRTYTSSIYVDAFNLALNTVLKDEAYLFSEEEAEVFAKYRSFEYEAQHLYVRLFLRKSSAWFRIDKLSYPNDISDLPHACRILQSPEVGFADSDDQITLEEVAALLPLDELKVAAKENALCSAGNKSQLIEALKKSTNGQASLKSRGGKVGLSYDAKGNYVGREKAVIGKLLQKTGSCIRLSSSITTLFDRVHLVFYRSTEWSEKSLTTLILSRTSKLNFPSYIVSRTSSIFPTRDSLLSFEAAIQLQSEVDTILESPDCRTESGLSRLRAIFDEAYPIWQSLVSLEEATSSSSSLLPENLQERIYLRRFTSGWVYTRIIHKALYVLARNKEYVLEHSVLTALLAQPYFQPARRGPWYQRKALIEENHLPSLDPCSTTQPSLTTRKYRLQALKTCEAGLRDAQCHTIYHYDLQKRIEKLEHKLKIPKRDQHDFSHLRLSQPSERVFYGERINDVEIGRKTLWRDPNGVEKAGVSVEQMCLAQYAKLGWKGLHCEGRLMRTLFAYLFYDILFLYLPNVFETGFQTCPLDLFTDAFYPSRASEINHRLVEIANGGARRIVDGVWERENKRKTCVVGLDWGVEKRVLDEVLTCIPPEALSIICKVFCQEYRQRSGGMPDLFLWRLGMGRGRGGGECCFAEVKSENDRLSDTQRMWIHVLTGAGVRVELCAAKNTRKGEGKDGKGNGKKMWPIKSG